jgi:exonuclease 3'-5' domain-containing protein 1
MQHIASTTVDNAAHISALVNYLVAVHPPLSVPCSPVMYMDLEGINLSREGSVSIITLLVKSPYLKEHTFLIDVHTLGAQAFNTPGSQGQTLKDILQDPNKTKVFFDVRNDSDALFAHFGVALQGVEDVQLMESATRKTTRSRRFVSGLAKCIEQNMSTSQTTADLARWKLAKEKGEQLFHPSRGGSYAVFNQRPMPADIIAYCVGDVQHLPALRQRFFAQTTRQRGLISEETKKRVALSQSANYQPHGPEKAKAPWSKQQNDALDRWNHVPGRVDDDAFIGALLDERLNASHSASDDAFNDALMEECLNGSGDTSDDAFNDALMEECLNGSGNTSDDEYNDALMDECYQASYHPSHESSVPLGRILGRYGR